MSSGRDRMASKTEKYGEVKNFWGDPVKSEEYKKLKLKWGAHYERECRLCGCPLGFGYRVGTGKTVALDLASTIYCVTGGKNPGQPDEVVETKICYVDHYYTCTKLVKKGAQNG